MSHLSPILMIVWLTAVSAQDDSAPSAQDNPAPSAWTKSRSAALRSLPSADSLRLWWLLGELRRPAAAPQGTFRHWRPEPSAGVRGGAATQGAATRGTAASTVEAWPIAERPTRGEPVFTLCGAHLTNLIADICHGRLRRSGRTAAAPRLQSPLLRNRRQIVDECCNRPCGMITLLDYVETTCDVSSDTRDALSLRMQTLVRPYQTSADESNAPVTTTMGTPPVHTPVVEDRGFIEDGFQKRDISQPSHQRWTTGRFLPSLQVV